MNHIVHLLRERLKSSLPGLQAQRRMSPVSSQKYFEVPDNAVSAGVMLLLHPVEDDLIMTLIRRPSNNPLDKHAGQLSFPGGKFEVSDESMLHCALREAEEELGISPQDITVLGNLSPLYIFASNFHVHPYVGWISERPTYRPQVEEVEEILEVSLKYLMMEEVKIYKDISARSIVLKDVPCYDINGNILWGATAMMVSEFETIISELLIEKI